MPCVLYLYECNDLCTQKANTTLTWQWIILCDCSSRSFDQLYYGYEQVKACCSYCAYSSYLRKWWIEMGCSVHSAAPARTALMLGYLLSDWQSKAINLFSSNKNCQ